MAAKKASNAVLVPGRSITQLVVQELLNGLEIKVKIGKKNLVGYVHSLHFSRGCDYVFADAFVPYDEKGKIDDAYLLKVSIHTDGSVNIMPYQED